MTRPSTAMLRHFARLGDCAVSMSSECQISCEGSASAKSNGDSLVSKARNAVFISNDLFLDCRAEQQQRLAENGKMSTEIIGIQIQANFCPEPAYAGRKNAFRSLRKLKRRINRENRYETCNAYSCLMNYSLNQVAARPQ